MKWTLNRLRIVSLILRLLGTILLFLAFFPPQEVHPWLPLGGTILFFGLSTRLDYRGWRCPHCGRHLGKRMFPLPEHCPHCKNLLEPSQEVHMLQPKAPPHEEHPHDH